MNLRQLNHLIALADEGRFVAAAERVHLSQAAFSRSIQALEDHFGLRLFERGPGGARLTPAGRVLVERARALVFDSRCLQRDAELLRGGTLGDLAFGAGPIPAAVLVPPLLAELRRRAPQVVARVRHGNVASLLALLQAEEVDFFVGDARMLDRSAEVATVPLAKIGGALYVRRGHPLASSASVAPAELARFGIGIVSTTKAVLAYVARALGFAADAKLPLAVECDDLHALASLAIEGDLVVALPHAFVASAGLRLVPLPGPGGQSTVQVLHVDAHAVWLRGRTLAPAAAGAIQLLEVAARGLANTVPAPTATRRAVRRTTGLRPTAATAAKRRR